MEGEFQYQEEEVIVARAPERSADSIEQVLMRVARSFAFAGFGLLPLLFVPVGYAPFDYSKLVILIVCLIGGIVFFSLSVLRSGVIKLSLSYELSILALVVIVSFLSALFSGDRYTSFIGDSFNVQTAFFTLSLFVVVAAIPYLVGTKMAVMRLFVFLLGSALVLGVFTLLRLLTGWHFLDLHVLSGKTANLLGSFNDLGLFFGMVVLVSMISLEQLSLTKVGRILFLVTILVSLLVLMVVNFFAVWIVLGVVSLIMLMYALTRDHFQKHDDSLSPTGKLASGSLASILVSTTVFVVAILFVIGGGVVGGIVGKVTGVSYLEVRPSFQATFDIARSVWHHSPLLGVGPNRFASAWELYRNPAINQTIFWSVNFQSGSGFIPTMFVTTGLLGGILWLGFIITFLFGGARLLFKTTQADRVWYFIATSSYVAAAYLWLMTIVYNPGIVMLVLAALFTGIVIAAKIHLHGVRTFTISALETRRAGFVLVGSVMIIIVTSVSALYYVGRHYAANYTFAAAVSGQDGSKTLEEVEQKIANAYALVPSATYARQIALYQVGKMNSLLSVQKPTKDQQQAFNTAAVNGVSAARQAVAAGSKDPANYAAQGSVLSVLAATGVTNASTTAMSAYEEARKLDPSNPLYPLLEAQLLARIKDNAGARDKINEAIKLKPDYTDALTLLAQLDIADGKTTDAIKVSQSIITLDPNNPARYYQLGILLAANKQSDEAIASFEAAVKLDQNYANARYMLALLYADKGEKDKALAELDAVIKLNPKNADLTKLRDKIASGASLTTTPSSAAAAAPENTPPVTTNTDGSVTSTEQPTTPLVSPVNGGTGSATTASTGSSTAPGN